MKFLAVLALAAVALAAPAEEVPPRECSPAQYSCTDDNKGWRVCNVNGTWLAAGTCKPNETCKPINGLPYCI
jgi:hypothetical protein